MRRLLRKFDLDRPTVARDLTLGLLSVSTAVFALVGTINYIYSIRRDTRELHAKAAETLQSLASVLATPVWNLNSDEISKVVDVYRQSGTVLDIRVVDDLGHDLVAARNEKGDPFLELTRPISHGENEIGQVRVTFADAGTYARQRQVAGYSLVVFLFLTVALTIATTVLLRRFLTRPLLNLADGLAVIARGNYTHRFSPLRQAELSDITRDVMLMAQAIEGREAALEANRDKLATLNQAILDMFSCSDAASLMSTALHLAHRVAAVDLGWFLPRGVATEDATSPTLASLVLRQSRVTNAPLAECETGIKNLDPDRTFTFPIKTRDQGIGSMVLSYALPPDASVLSLLKSLMSLTALALSRQAFIRETAVIGAELQVAEAVQRSLLLENSKLVGPADVSYHYEPVHRVGGDWFSIIESKDAQSLYVILGDVTGHGLAQGLVTTAMAGALSIVEAVIRSQSGKHLPAPSQLVGQLGDVVHRLAGKSHLGMTCVAARIDFQTGQLTVCNAGHTFPLLLRRREDGQASAKVESLVREQQRMLGDLSPHATVYRDATYHFREQDLLIVYTDGLTDALDREGKAFRRLFHRFVSKQTDLPSPENLLQNLLTIFREHTAQTPVRDDVCVLVVGAKARQSTQAA